MTKTETKINLAILVVAVICFTALVSNDNAVILNPDGFGAYGSALMFVAVSVGLFFTILSLRKPVAEKLSATIFIGLIVWPASGLFVYLLFSAALPALSLAVSASTMRVPATVIASETHLNSSICTISRGRKPVAYVVRLEGQPPMLGKICVKSIEGSARGQKAFYPPPMPDLGPVLIEGQGNWFAVRVEQFAPA
ncbi:MAG: hypothetical protein AAFY06_11725 [Pseudomonadota bacterium]